MKHEYKEMIKMINYPLIINIKDVFGNPSQYFVDGYCNMYRYDGYNLIPIHVIVRKKDGRPLVTINLDGTPKTYLVYRLLMQAVYDISYDEFSKYVVDHIDCDSSHTEFFNFELVSQAENMRRAGANNLIPSGERHFNSKYSDKLIAGICEDICNNLSRNEIMEKRHVNGQLVDDIRSGRSHRKISEQYVDQGFLYKTYDRSEKIKKAIDVCKLLEEGYTISQTSSITGYGRNFVEPIYNKRTFKDVSKNYNF